MRQIIHVDKTDGHTVTKVKPTNTKVKTHIESLAKYWMENAEVLSWFHKRNKELF